MKPCFVAIFVAFALLPSLSMAQADGAGGSSSEHNGNATTGSGPASVSQRSPSPAPASNAGNISNADMGKTPNGSMGIKSSHAGTAKDSSAC
ncbi:MAG: hypothetical protein ABI615_14300 [Chthoniobacterales bacterium]